MRHIFQEIRATPLDNNRLRVAQAAYCCVQHTIPKTSSTTVEEKTQKKKGNWQDDKSKDLIPNRRGKRFQLEDKRKKKRPNIIKRRRFFFFFFFLILMWNSLCLPFVCVCVRCTTTTSICTHKFQLKWTARCCCCTLNVNQVRWRSRWIPRETKKKKKYRKQFQDLEDEKKNSKNFFLNWRNHSRKSPTTHTHTLNFFFLSFLDL